MQGTRGHSLLLCIFFSTGHNPFIQHRRRSLRQFTGLKLKYADRIKMLVPVKCLVFKSRSASCNPHPTSRISCRRITHARNSLFTAVVRTETRLMSQSRRISCARNAWERVLRVLARKPTTSYTGDCHASTLGQNAEVNANENS